jgi:hypothetical protein
MEKYVLLYHFKDQGAEQHFEEAINDVFWRHQVEENAGIKYFGFAAREEPGVVDKINSILDPLDTDLGKEDYVALYYTKPAKPDKIRRQMVLGRDKLIETEIEENSFDSHRNSLTRLLDYDYVRAQPEPPHRKGR